MCLDLKIIQRALPLSPHQDFALNPLGPSTKMFKPGSPKTPLAVCLNAFFQITSVGDTFSEVNSAFPHYSDQQAAAGGYLYYSITEINDKKLSKSTVNQFSQSS